MTFKMPNITNMANADQGSLASFIKTKLVVTVLSVLKIAKFALWVEKS